MKQKRKKKSYTKYLQKWSYIFMAPFFIIFGVFFLFPTLYSFYVSLTDNKIGREVNFIGLQNYIRLFTTDQHFWPSVKNTFIIVIFTLPTVIVLGILLANFLFNEKRRGRVFFQTANYLPNITSPIAIGIIFSLMFDQKVGIVNKILVKLGIFEQAINWLTAPSYLQRTMLVLMCIWQSLGYYMLMYLSAMTAIPQDLYEAAKVDGANKLQILLRITVPMLKNTTQFLIINSMIGLLQMFDQPYLLMRGLSGSAINTIEKPLETVMVSFYEYSMKTGRLGYGATVTYGLFIIILLCVSITRWVISKKEDPYD